MKVIGVRIKVIEDVNLFMGHIYVEDKLFFIYKIIDELFIKIAARSVKIK